MSTSAYKRLTVEEFLAREEQSDVRHEYFDGEAFAMAGGSAMHSLTAGNLGRELGNTLKDRCRVFTSDMMVWCPTGLRTYPDVPVACDRPRYEGDKQRVLLNPRLLVEVLSETTEAYDRGKKFEHYQAIESLREYLLVSHDRPHADLFVRGDDGRWVLTPFDGLDASIELPDLGVVIPMTEVYAGVEFPPTADPQPDPQPQPETP